MRAAQGLSLNLEHQVELAAGLMGVTLDEVREEVRRAAADPVISTRQRAGRTQVVVVQRRSHKASPGPVGRS